MMWLLQEMLKGAENSNYLRFRRALLETNTPYIVTSYNKDEGLIVLNSDYIPRENSEFILKELTSSPYIPRGSVKLDELTMGDTNNVFYTDNRITYENITDFVPVEYLLNNPSQIGKIGDLKSIADEFILRPVSDDKAINGGVFTADQLFQLQKDYVTYSNFEAIAKSKFIIAPVQGIESEYRYFVVGGKIISRSSYKKDGVFNIDFEIPQEVDRFTENIVGNHPIGQHYVIDTCRVSDGSLKVVEFNGIVASGLYNCSEYDLIAEMNKLIK